MKRTWVIILFILGCNASKAQSTVYYPMPDSNAVWNVWLSDADCFSWQYWEKFSYVFGGDTIIGLYSYHKIYKPYIEIVGCSASMGPFSHYNRLGLAGCIRQDTLNKLVFIVPPNDTSELILYDFNLQVNDTLVGFANYECQETKTISSIDSILIGNNFRKRFNITEPTNFDYSIIEGVGSTVGLLDFCNYSLSPCNHLGCYEENGQTLYSNGGVFSNCSIISLVENLAQVSLSGSIYPNPFHSTAILKIGTPSLNTDLYLFDVFFRQVGHYKIQSTVTEINREGLSDGIYFYRVMKQANTIINGRIVIQ